MPSEEEKQACLQRVPGGRGSGARNWPKAILEKKYSMKTDTFDLNGRQIKKKTIPDLPQNPKLRDYARENRKGYNMAEVMFWRQVHKKKFHGIDFNRQYIIGNYIADFYLEVLVSRFLIFLHCAPSALRSFICNCYTCIFLYHTL